MAQMGPVQNYEDINLDKKIKSLKTMFYRSKDTVNSEGRLLFSKTFNEKGQLIKRYNYTFWDVVSYDHTSTYIYNTEDLLIEETKIQRILNLGKRDEGYIKALGDDPLNEKIFYYYNSNKNPIKRVEYSFGREGFDPNQEPFITKEFFYDKKGLLTKETSQTPNGRVISENYILEFTYDKKSKLISQLKTYTTDKSNKSPNRLTQFKYNRKGLLVDEIVTDNQIPRNNRHLKYEYNKSGKKTKTYRFDNSENNWKLIKSFDYNKDGQLILGDDETTFNFYKNGLIKQELWESSKSDETVNFITAYEFY